MKPQKLSQYLRKFGGVPVGNCKGSHQKWEINGITIPVPMGHKREIHKKVIKRICKAVNIPDPTIGRG